MMIDTDEADNSTDKVVVAKQERSPNKLQEARVTVDLTEFNSA